MRPTSPTAALLAAAAFALAGCGEAPLRWAPATPGAIPAAPGSAPALPDLPPATLATLPQHPSGVRCAATLQRVALPRVAGATGATPAADAAAHAAMGHDAVSSGSGVAGGRTAPGAPDTADVVAVWWSVRPDSSAWLVSARGTTGGTAGGARWEPAVPVDTFDRGLRGCARPAPAVAFEPATRYVHVVYFLDAPEGPGLFYAHSMDAGRLYDPEPEPVVYGARVSRAAVAARRDTVAVAFEDPNTEPAQVTLAFSVTGGHLWVDKTIRVSGTTTTAEAPAVVVDSAGVTVGWMERQGGSATPVTRRGTWARAR